MSGMAMVLSGAQKVRAFGSREWQHGRLMEAAGPDIHVPTRIPKMRGITSFVWSAGRSGKARMAIFWLKVRR